MESLWLSSRYLCEKLLCDHSPQLAFTHDRGLYQPSAYHQIREQDIYVHRSDEALEVVAQSQFSKGSINERQEMTKGAPSQSSLLCLHAHESAN